MNAIPFKIMPSIGYLNTDYQFIVNDLNIRYIEFQKMELSKGKSFWSTLRLLFFYPFYQPSSYNARCNELIREYLQEIVSCNSFMPTCKVVLEKMISNAFVAAKFRSV